VHYAPSPPAPKGTPDGGIALRGNYAGVGFTYDAENDVFYEPQPFPSWVLNNNTWLWEAPVPYPADGNLANPAGDVHYRWDEPTVSWVTQS
jgi:hypothetical protein